MVNECLDLILSEFSNTEVIADDDKTNDFKGSPLIEFNSYSDSFKYKNHLQNLYTNFESEVNSNLSKAIKQSDYIRFILFKAGEFNNQIQLIPSSLTSHDDLIMTSQHISYQGSYFENTSLVCDTLLKKSFGFSFSAKAHNWANDSLITASCSIKSTSYKFLKIY